MVVYVSGDGGENNFSGDFVNGFNNHGYPVVLFNTLKYFWSKKEPAQAAKDIEAVITTYKRQWHKNNVILIGYSIGADVLPFVYTRLGGKTQALVKNIVLLSPSNYTDFEVHLTYMFSKNKGSYVPDEINKITKPVLIVQGNKEENRINIDALKNKNLSRLVLPGGHNYSSNTSDVVNGIIQKLVR